MPDFIIPVLLLIDGLITVILAVFAHEMGLDPTTSWGRGRFGLLIFGILLIGLCALWVISRNSKLKAFATFRSEQAKTWFLLGHLWAIILILYVWFITYGNFNTWDHTTHYYTQLADAFSQGHASVDRKPDKALLEAPDPYDQMGRPHFSDEIWDLSLYKGKLYLYWGPVPALLITPIQIAFKEKITDNYLVFFFFAGLLTVNSLMIIKLRKNFYPEIPAGNMFMCIALIGLILPISWSLNSPNVYEAAIGAGQFFLLGGIYFILRGIELSAFHNKASLFLAGIFWACAVGSRAINVFSVIFLVAFTSFWIARQLSKPVRWREIVRVLFPLYVPLVIGALLIGWYNWIRFDSPLEFGLRYQITIFNLNKDMGLTFKSDYLPLNLYVYGFQPFRMISEFPFLQPIMTSTVFDEFKITAPYLYLAGRLTGLLFGAPFLILSIANLFLKDRTRQDVLPNAVSQRSFVVTLLAGSFLINSLTLLFFFFAQMRYLVDIISQLTLLAIIGYWEILRLRQVTRSLRSKFFVSAANVLIVFTIVTSLLLALTGETSRMQTLNPALFEKINSALSVLK